MYYTLKVIQKKRPQQEKQGIQMEEQYGKNLHVCIAVDQNKNELSDAKKDDDENKIGNAFVL
jgi:hypothetical protein